MSSRKTTATGAAATTDAATTTDPASPASQTDAPKANARQVEL